MSGVIAFDWLLNVTGEVDWLLSTDWVSLKGCVEFKGATRFDWLVFGSGG